MKNYARLAGRLLVTLVAVAVAVVVWWQLWAYYMDAPWTRDGRVRADVLRAAPDVSGLVTEVVVADNETVQKGQVLFRIDPERFRLALAQAEAVVASRLASAQEAVREMNRYRQLSTLEVSEEEVQQRTATAASSGAAYQQALADRDVAQLNLQRTAVTSTVNGPITNFTMRPGDYVTAGTAVAAIVDTDSFYVDGYFEETKLRRIAIGDPARVWLLGDARPIEGHVQSIAGGIADAEVSNAPSLLAAVNPTFNWVRLPQRVPVRIALDKLPGGVLAGEGRLISGRTATVEILPAKR